MLNQFDLSNTRLKHRPGSEANEVVLAFNRCFATDYLTTLQGGVIEPFYEVHANGSAVVYFREDFVASALHEAAHWCLAGKTRRKQNDYGYWYEPVRDEAAQQQFEAVEVRPQALEWLFSQSLGIPFRVSADNLQLPNHDTRPFRAQIRMAAETMLATGLNRRAERFAEALYALRSAPRHWRDIRQTLCVRSLPN